MAEKGSVADLVRVVEERLGTDALPSARPASPRSASPRPTDWDLFRWAKPGTSSRFVLGVTTYNRLEYLRRFVESFQQTKSDRFDWILVIADDGSTDGTVEYISTLSLADVTIIKIYNHGARIAGQTNSILSAAEALEYDFGIKCDDDIFFKEAGWDTAYFSAAETSGFDHLVYHNDDWKPPEFRHERPGLIARTSATNALGCLWSFTPRMVRSIGYFDERAFPVRGHSHLDFTHRAARAGFNEIGGLWDSDTSDRTIGMWDRDEYTETIDWDSDEVKKALSAEERRRRVEIVENSDRRFIPFLPDPGRPLPVVAITPHDPSLAAALALRGLAPHGRGQSQLYDQTYVLNLPHHRERWIRTAAQLSAARIPFRRAPTVNGYSDRELSGWRDYARSGLTHSVEKQIGRKLIQSPGAWGYLSSMIATIDAARDQRVNRLLVFDDDILLHREFGPAVNRLIDRLPPDWRLVYLGASYEDKEEIRQVDDGVADPGPRTNGSFAHVLHSSVFSRVEELSRQREWPYDSGPLRSIREEHPGLVVSARPEIVVADVSASSIRHSRDQAWYADRMGWEMDRYAPPPDPGPLVGVVVFCDHDYIGLRETLISLRYQSHANFRVVAICPLDAPEVAAVARRCQQEDPRLLVATVDTHEPVGAWAAGACLFEEMPIVHLLAGDILFPDHLEAMLDVLPGAEVVAPMGITVPEPSVVSGQWGQDWDVLRERVADNSEAGIVFSRAMIDWSARQMIGDLQSLSDAVVRSQMENLHDPHYLEVPTILVRERSEPVGQVGEVSTPPFFLHPSRSLPLSLFTGSDDLGIA